MLSGNQEKLIVAYFQGGNARDIKNYKNLEQILNTIKRTTEGPLSPKEEREKEED